MTHTSQHGGGIQHLAHAGTTLRTFVANNNYVTGLYFLAANCCNSFILGIVYLGRTTEYLHSGVNSGFLNNGAFRSNIAL